MAAIKKIAELLSAHPLFEGFDSDTMEFLAGCAENKAYRKGEYIFKTGEPADKFYILRSGDVALEMQIPGRARLTVQSLHTDQLIGASWMLPPFTWRLDARAMTNIRVTRVDAACLRDKCDENHELGYTIMKRFLPIIAERLQATRMQLVDLYAPMSEVGTRL